MTNPAEPGEFIRFGAFQVDSSSGELRKNGIKIRLPDQSFQILQMLTESPGKVVTREELRNKLWPADTFVDFDNGLNSAILRLRNALGDSAEHPRYIETLPRRGYRFVAEVTTEAATAPGTGAPPDSIEREEIASSVESEGSEAAKPSPLPLLRRAGRFGVAAVAASIAGILILSLYLGRQWPFGTNAAVKIQSVAVLPLENLSGDPSQEYFVDGMTDALITDLAQVQALRVTSRTSTMQYKGSKKRLPQIARELNVDAVVEGTVVRSGERVRIDAQLVQANTDRHLWAKSYERDLRDVVALQGEVARAIADEIHVYVSPEERSRLAAATPVNGEAYQAYLKGRFLWNERTEKSVAKGIEFFEQAVAKDPNYAFAYSGLSDSYGLLGFYGVLPPREAYERAKAAAVKALDINPSLAEAHVSLGETKFFLDSDWPGAEAEFKKAIELDPKYDTAYRKYSNYLIAMGRTEESIAAAKKALELDPLSITLSTHLGWMLYLAHQTDLAVQQYEKTLEMSPNYARARRDFSLALVEKGRYEDAIREARRGIELSQASPLMLEAVGYAYAKAGKKDEARKVLRDLRELSRNRYVSSFNLAVIYAGLGEKDAAFSFLERAYQEHAGQLIWLDVNPALDSLHSDARFAELVSRVGLPKTHPKVVSGP
jgi:TolB-like protein/DNA-binding winged helix-turn-helix (wHTH) protein/Flp pilus assembly protein TadD